MRGEVPPSRRPSRDRGHHPKGEEGREPPGEKGMEKGLMSQGDVAQQQGRESLGQRAPKGSCSLSFFIAIVFVLSLAGKYWVQFCRVYKAGGL